MGVKSIGELYREEYRQYENMLIWKKELDIDKFFIIGLSDIKEGYYFEHYDNHSGYIYKNISHGTKVYKIGIHHVVSKEVFDGMDANELDSIFNLLYNTSEYYTELFGMILCSQKTALEVLILNFESKETVYSVDKKVFKSRIKKNKLEKEIKQYSMKLNDIFISRAFFNYETQGISVKDICTGKYIKQKKNYLN